MEDLEHLKQELASYCQLAYHRLYTCGTGGNISVRISDTDTALISPSGYSLRDVCRENIITMNLRGEKIDGPSGMKPSKEGRMHGAIYASRPDVKAVCHLHPPYSIAWSARHQAIPLVTVSAEAKLGVTSIIPKARPGSDELLQYVAEEINRMPEKDHTMLLVNHGIISFGESLADAFNKADLAEETAKIAFMMINLGVKDYNF